MPHKKLGDGRAKAAHPAGETQLLSTEAWPACPRYGPNSKSLKQGYNRGLHKRHQILGSHVKSQRPQKTLTKYLILDPL